jgi:DNA-binding PadR family transcriptional regulator
MWQRSEQPLGELEQLVLLVVLRLGEQAYGIPIVDQLRAHSHHRVSRPAVYLALARLEQKALLSATIGEPTRTRGGRAKRYYRVTPRGLSVLRAVRQTYLTLWHGVEMLLDR